MVIREGDLFEVGSGDFRVIQRVISLSDAAGGEDGRERWLLDNGAILANLSFTDGTNGMFWFNTNPVPEPTSAGALTLCGLLLLLRRRNK